MLVYSALLHLFNDKLFWQRGFVSDFIDTF